MFHFLSLTLLERLEQWDQWLFLRINNGLANPFFDSMLPYLRESVNWAPLYLFLAVFVLINFKGNGAWWILFFIVTVAVTDMTGTYLFKHNFERARPCMDPDFYSRVRTVIQCGGGNSFISNHAANHFGMAMFLFITFRNILNKWAWLIFVWPAAIVFAQVYLGFHYPLDILAGMIIGLLAGRLTGGVFNKRYGFAIFGNQPTVSS